jgi:hypothetical protein
MAGLSDNDYGYNFPSVYVDAKVLAAATAETFVVPANRRYMRLKFSAAGYYKWSDASGTPVAAVPAADIADGTSSVMVNPYDLSEGLIVSGGEKVSVIIAGGGVVTAEYY